MKNETKKSDDAVLLKTALKIAAIEAYQSEIIDTEMSRLVIGTDKEFESVQDWIQYRIDSWLEEAELKT